MHFSGNLSRVMAARNLSQEALAKEMGVSQATISRWENGVVPHRRTLLRLAELLGVPPDQLTSRKIEPEFERHLEQQRFAASVAETPEEFDEISESIQRVEDELQNLKRLLQRKRPDHGTAPAQDQA